MQTYSAYGLRAIVDFIATYFQTNDITSFS